jgi:hypothetical protein
LRARIGLAALWPLAGAVATAARFALLMVCTCADAPQSLWWIVGFYAAAAELVMRRGPRATAR